VPITIINDGRGGSAPIRLMLTRRLSASLVVLRDARAGFEVLMVQRSKRMAFAGSTWVFPGGVWDAADGATEGTETDADVLDLDSADGGVHALPVGDVLRTIALRETFEETGILPLPEGAMAGCSEWLDGGRGRAWGAWRERTRKDAAQWSTFLTALRRGSGGLVDPESCVKPLCAFLTPTFEAERSGREYLTYFLIARLNSPPSPSPSSPSSSAAASSPSEPWNHCDVDGEETVRSEWLSPQEILSRSVDGSMSFFPPQFYILQRLCAFDSASDAMSGADWFSGSSTTNAGSNGKEHLPIVMRPELVDNADLVLPFDAEHKAHPGDEKARHRVVGWKLKKGTAELQMNDTAAALLHGADRAWQWPRDSV
jgi:8-oxo-dGTP pyrophosphatase MutT (NUDIX family)